MLFPPVRDGQQTGDGYILFDTEERALSALRRLTGARMRDKLTIDIWHPPSRTSHEGPTSSLTEPTPTPNTTPQQQKTPEIPQSLAEDLQIQQLFIGCLPSWLPEHDLHDRLTTMFEPFGKIKWLRIGGVLTPTHIFSSDLMPQVTGVTPTNLPFLFVTWSMRSPRMLLLHTELRFETPCKLWTISS